MSADTSAGPTILCFLLKVASRCNLACDYCYMYEHTDQSWRKQPHMFSSETSPAVVKRIGEYVAGRDLQRKELRYLGPLAGASAGVMDVKPASGGAVLSSIMIGNVPVSERYSFRSQMGNCTSDRCSRVRLRRCETLISR